MHLLRPHAFVLLLPALLALPALAQSPGGKPLRVPPPPPAGGPGACSTGSATRDLDQNNVRARLYNNGHLFWKGAGNVYTVPKRGAANALFASGIWIGGLVGTEVRFAGTDYGPFEFFPGPLDGQGRPPADCVAHDRIYSVTRADLANYDAGRPHSKDVEEWPWQLGAPVRDGDGNPGNYDLGAGDRPGLLGEQTAWWVMNDAAGVKDWSGTPPVHLEVQVTAFAFRTPDALGNTTFYRYRLVYRGREPFHDVYFGIWTDPDVGNATDDYIGADTTLGLGFAYNGDAFDDGSDGYGDHPAAVGYDFLQGPRVASDGVDNDRDGQVDERADDGLDNDGDGATDEPDEDERLKMTVFLAYSGDSGPTGNPDGSSDDPHHYLRGFWRDGQPMTYGGYGYGGETRTTIMWPGDPVTKAYWSEFDTDGTGRHNQPSDRRFILSTGPFAMAPGDVQEIVYAIVWSQAGGGPEPNLAAVARLKADDAYAQAAFDAGFVLPALHAPAVHVSPGDQSAVLSWSYPPEDDNYLDGYDVLNPFLQGAPADVAPDKTYTFEGYKVYRYDGPDDDTGELLAVYDVDNGVRAAEAARLIDRETDQLVEVVTAVAPDSGLQHTFAVRGLTNYREHAFGVQAYAYNAYSSPRLLESPVTRVTVVPSRVDARDGGTVVPEDALAARRAAGDTLGFDLPGVREGRGQGQAGADLVDPLALTGHRYEIRFFDVPVDRNHDGLDNDADQATDEGDEVVPAPTYDLVDATTGEVKLDGRAYFDRTGAPVPQRARVAVVDGLEFTVLSPPHGIEHILVTANAAGPLAPPDMGTFAFNANGFPTADGLEAHCLGQTQTVNWAECNDRPSEAQQVGPAEWGINAGGGDGTYASFLSRSLRIDDVDRLGAYDYEIRFTEAGGYGWAAFTDGAAIRVPFELWRTGVGTPDDPGDDVRLIPYLNDTGAEHAFGLSGDHPVSGGDNDPVTDWIYGYLPVDQAPGDAGYRAFEAAMRADPAGYDSRHEAGEVFARLVLVNWNGGVLPQVNQALPEAGTVFRIVTTKPNRAGDRFTFDTADVGLLTNQRAVAERALSEIGIVPNPYKGASAYEVSAFADEVRFTNLPERAHVRVYTVSGVLVWEAELGRDNNRWNLQTSEGLPLGSGMYLVHVDVPGLGERVIKFGCIKKRVQLDLL